MGVFLNFFFLKMDTKVEVGYIYLECCTGSVLPFKMKMSSKLCLEETSNPKAEIKLDNECPV